MASFCATIKRDSVSPLRFPLLSHVKVFSFACSPVLRLKYQYSCFSHFRYTDFVVFP